MPEPRLCYVEARGRAYFTTCPLDRQWGDDWNDKPYDYNAGEPYDWSDTRGVPPYKVVLAFWRGPWETPAQRVGGNSRWSVQEINRKFVAWLLPSWLEEEPAPPIYAGTTLSEFRRIIKEHGGTVYLEDGA